MLREGAPAGARILKIKTNYRMNRSVRLRLSADGASPFEFAAEAPAPIRGDDFLGFGGALESCERLSRLKRPKLVCNINCWPQQ